MILRVVTMVIKQILNRINCVFIIKTQLIRLKSCIPMVSNREFNSTSDNKKQQIIHDIKVKS